MKQNTSKLDLNDTQTIAGNLFDLLDKRGMDKRVFNTPMLREMKPIKNKQLLHNILEKVLPESDREIITLIREMVGDRLVYTATGARSGEWYIWDSTIHLHSSAFEYSGSADIPQLLANAVTELYDTLDTIISKTGAELLTDENRWLRRIFEERVAGMRKRYLSSNGVNALETMLIREFGRTAEYFVNTDKKQIVFSNGYYLTLADIAQAGTIDDLFRLLREPEPGNRNLKKTAIHLTENFQSSGHWQAFLDRAVVDSRLKPIKEDQKTLQMLAGAALLGAGDVKHIVHITGPRNSGKGSYVSMLSKVLGGNNDKCPGYAPSVSAAAIENGNRFNRAELMGARIPYVQEVTQEKVDGGFLKTYSGGESQLITTEEKNKNPVTWKAEGILHVIANHRIRFDLADSALRKRILLFDFPHTIAEDDPNYDSNFENDIIAHDGEGILRWVLQGAIDYIQNDGRIPISQHVLDRQNEEFIASSIPVEWITTKIEEGQFEIVPNLPKKYSVRVSKKLYEAFYDWAKDVAGYQMNEIPSRAAWYREVATYLGMSDSDQKKKTDGYFKFHTLKDMITDNGVYTTAKNNSWAELANAAR